MRKPTAKSVEEVNIYLEGLSLRIPDTSTDNAVARFDGTGGALQNSGVTISDTGVWFVTAYTEFMYSMMLVRQHLSIVVNSSTTSYVSNDASTASVIYGANVSGLYSLTAGDTVNVNMSVSTGNVQCGEARFTVHRVA